MSHAIIFKPVRNLGTSAFAFIISLERAFCPELLSSPWQEWKSSQGKAAAASRTPGSRSHRRQLSAGPPWRILPAFPLHQTRQSTSTGRRSCFFTALLFAGTLPGLTLTVPPWLQVTACFQQGFQGGVGVGGGGSLLMLSFDPSLALYALSFLQLQKCLY